MMTDKRIHIICMSTPDRPGYDDFGEVLQGTGDTAPTCLWRGTLSTCPNWRIPLLLGARHWTQAYGWIAPGKFTWRCVEHPKHRKCLLINEGAGVSARNANPRHNGQKVLAEVFIHEGQTDKWRGSAGCITVPPAEWERFMASFALNDRGELTIRETDGSKA